jgi:hypothetical protein
MNATSIGIALTTSGKPAQPPSNDQTPNPPKINGESITPKSKDIPPLRRINEDIETAKPLQAARAAGTGTLIDRTV